MWPEDRARRRSLLLLAPAAFALAIAGGLSAAWFARNLLGERLGVDYLRRRGIPATINLTRLDRRRVEGSLVLGPVSQPTLTVAHFVAEFATAPPFSVPRLRRLRLTRPRLALSFDGRRLDFGPLQPLVDEATKAPRGAAPSPSPDVLVSDGELLIRTPYGLAPVGVDADVVAGKVSSATLRPRPMRLRSSDAGLDLASGLVVLKAAGADRYVADAGGAATRTWMGRTALNGVEVRLHAELPYAAGAANPWAGAVLGSLQASARELQAPGGASAGVRIDAAVQGDLLAGASPAFQGRATAHGSADKVAAGGAELHRVRLDLGSSHLAYGAGRTLDARLILAVSAPSGLAQAAGERVALSALRLSARGRLRTAGRGGPWLDAEGSLATTGGLARARAQQLAHSLAPGPYGDDLRPALGRALTLSSITAPDFRLMMAGDDWRLRFPVPAQVDAMGAGRLSASGSARGGWGLAAGRRAIEGEAVLALGGGGFPQAHLVATNLSVSARGGRADLRGDVVGSAGPLRDVRLAMDGALIARSGAVALTLARCSQLAIDRFQGDAPTPLAKAASVQVCPASSGPLLKTDHTGWRLAAGLRALAVGLPGPELHVEGGDAELILSDRGGVVSGVAGIKRATLQDRSAPMRFGALLVSGPLKVQGDAITGTLDLALAQAARPLGRLQLVDDLHSGAGSLHLDAPDLLFATHGLQPAAVLPGLAGLGQDVSGPAQATVAATWRGPDLSTVVDVHLNGLQLKTTAGLLTGLRGELTLDKLDPLTSPPGQSLNADRLEAVTPLTDLSATFSLGDGALALAAAQASLAGGRVRLDPMQVALGPHSALNGVVRVDRIELGTVLDSLNLSRAVKIAATLSGAIPFSLGPQGLRIADGRLAAVEPGRLTLQREALTGLAASGAAGAASGSAVQDFAFQALEDLAFTELDASVASRPQGRLGIVFHIKGRHDPPLAKPARVGLIDLLRGRAFDKPLPLPKGTQVNLTLDSSLNLDELLAAYPGLSQPANSVQVHPQDATGGQG